MTGREIVLQIMEKRGVGYTQMATALGYKTPSYVRNRLIRQEDNAKDLSVDTIVKYLDYLGYEVCVREKGKSRAEYVISSGDE